MRTELILGALIPLAVLLAPAAPGQRTTYIVDSAQRPGTNFADLPAAVAAAAAGDVLVVRDGHYTGFTTSKPLAVLCQPGAILVAPASDDAAIAISGLPPGTEFVLQGLDMTWGNLTSTKLRIDQCAGQVLLDGIVGSHFLEPDRVAFATISWSRVALRGCVLVGGPGIEASGSVVTMADCTIDGASASFFFWPIPATSAVRAQDTELVLSRCELRGGNTFGGLPPPPAGQGLFMERSVVTVTGDGTTAIRAGTGNSVRVSAVGGILGELLIDPNRVTLVPHLAPPVGAAIPVTQLDLPSVSAHIDEAGPAMLVNLDGGAGSLYVLWVGVPGAATPTSFGPIWMALSPVPVTAASGILDPSGALTLSIPFAAVPGLLGKTLTWQAITQPPSTSVGWRLSNPATLVVH